MAEFSIGDAVGSGFNLIGRQPLSVLVWGLLLLVVQSLIFMNLTPMYSALLNQALTNPGGGPQAMQGMLAGFSQRMALGNLLGLVQVFVGAVIYCAVFRSVLRPEAPGIAYLRLGIAELLMFVFVFGVAFAFAIGALIMVLVVALIAAALAAAHAGVAAGILVFLAVIAAIWLIFYLALRLSMVGPTIVAENSLQIAKAWRLTRGRTGALFGVGLLLFVILLVGEIVIGVAFLAIGLGALSGAIGGLQNLAVALREQGPAVFSRITPLLITMAVISAPLLGCVYAIMGAPWARIYKDLAGPDVAATFS